MRGISTILVLTVAFSLSNCAKEEMQPAELVQWVQAPENGLRKTKTLNGVQFTIQYQPLDFTVANEIKQQAIREDQYLRRKAALGDLQRFHLTLDVAEGSTDIMHFGAGNERAYQDRLHYFSFGLRHDIQLECDGTRYPCKLFHFERSYDIGTHRNFVLGFAVPNTSDSKDLTIVVDCKPFATGPLKFKIRKEDIQRIPKIILTP